MRELRNILKDIKSGTLPMSEFPGFLLWAFRKSIRLLLVVTVAAVMFWRTKK